MCLCNDCCHFLSLMYFPLLLAPQDIFMFPVMFLVFTVTLYPLIEFHISDILYCIFVLKLNKIIGKEKQNQELGARAPRAPACLPRILISNCDRSGPCAST